MPPETPSDNDVLEKVDALLKKHQSKPFASSAKTPLAAPPETADFDDIPTLTDIVDAPPAFPPRAEIDYASEPGGAQNFAADELLRDLEERLYRELESRIAPQLSLAFGKALNELLEQAKIHISETVRLHLAQELNRPPYPAPENSGNETQA
jgi:hypothetical protein